MEKQALTKEVAEKLSSLREEIYSKTKEYNILAKQYNYADNDRWHYADDPVDPIVVFEGRDIMNVEPDEAKAWLPSQICW